MLLEGEGGDKGRNRVLREVQVMGGPGPGRLGSGDDDVALGCMKSLFGVLWHVKGWRGLVCVSEWFLRIDLNASLSRAFYYQIISHLVIH